MTWERVDNHTVRTSQEPINYATFGNPDDARIAVNAVNRVETLESDKRHAYERADQWEANYENLANSAELLIQALSEVLGFPDVAVDGQVIDEKRVLARLEQCSGAFWNFSNRADAVEHAALALAAVQEFDRRAAAERPREDAAEHVVEEEDPVLRYLRNLEGMDPDPVLEERIARMRSERLKELGR